MKVRLARGLRVGIEREARAAFPMECCGLIEGLRSDQIVKALALHPARNLAGASNRFEIDPTDHFVALKRAREQGHAIVGCYHSHPNGKPEPSARDREGAGEEDFLWLIAALCEASGPVNFGAFVYSGARTGFLPADLEARAIPDIAPPNRGRV